MTKRFWVSWNQPTADYRPLSDPPHPQVLGWWCSGYSAEGLATLCALVEASSRRKAEIYLGISWPEAREWRCFDEVPIDWRPGDRFVLKRWMEERMKPIYPESAL